MSTRSWTLAKEELAATLLKQEGSNTGWDRNVCGRTSWDIRPPAPRTYSSPSLKGQEVSGWAFASQLK